LPGQLPTSENLQSQSITRSYCPVTNVI